MATITLSSGSRYKDTGVYDSVWGPRFALFEAPPEFLGSIDAQLHEVQANEVGMLDILAVTYYGHGQEYLWWVIALANGIIDPDTETYVGQKLVIPSRALALSFVARS